MLAFVCDFFWLLIILAASALTLSTLYTVALLMVSPSIWKNLKVNASKINVLNKIREIKSQLLIRKYVQL